MKPTNITTAIVTKYISTLAAKICLIFHWCFCHISFETKKYASFGNWKSPGRQRAVLKVQRNLVTKCFFRSKPTERFSERITINWNFVTFKKANNFINSMVNTIHIKLILKCAVIYASTLFDMQIILTCFDTFFHFSLFPAFLNSHF